MNALHFLQQYLRDEIFQEISHFSILMEISYFYFQKGKAM